jgi:hypothetical protein
MVQQRRRLRSILLLSALVSVSSLWASDASATSPCQEAISPFLNMPAERTAAAVSGPNKASCWAAIESSNTSFDRLVHWVEQGNRWAAQYLAKHLTQLDGGNLEDALVALGQFSEHDIERLLVFAKSGLLSKHELSDAMRMLPLSLSDEPRAQLKRLSTRREKVRSVARKDLSEQKVQALTALDESASEIRSKNPGLTKRQVTLGRP